jgi:hypothetical protein
MHPARWLALVLVLAATGGVAQAQVFKPRTGNRAALPERPAPATASASAVRAPAQPGPVGPSSPAARKTGGAANGSVAAAPKKAIRAPGPGRRAGATPPRKKLRGASKSHDGDRAGDDDDVTISDD